MKPFSALVLLFALVAPPAIASEDKPLIDVARGCIESIRSGDRDAAEAALEKILEWRNVTDFMAIGNAVVCFDETRGPGWEYSQQLGRFLSPQEFTDQTAEEAAAAARQAEADRLQARNLRARLAAEREEAARQKAAIQEAVDATAAACVLLYRRDRVTALTNPVCSPIFLSAGLPD